MLLEERPPSQRLAAYSRLSPNSSRSSTPATSPSQPLVLRNYEVIDNRCLVEAEQLIQLSAHEEQDTMMAFRVRQ